LIEEAKGLNQRIFRLFEEMHTKLLDPKLTADERRSIFTNQVNNVPLVMSLDYLDHKFVVLERRISESAPGQIEHVRRILAFFLISGLIASCTVSLVLSRLFSKQIERRLEQLCKHAGLLSAGKELPVIDDIRDELGALEKDLRVTSIAIAESRRKELAVLENAADVLCSVDSHMKFIDVGESCTRVWKRTADDLAGASILSIVSQGTADATRSVFEQAIAESDQTVEHSLENMIMCGDGTTRNCLWRIVHSLEGNCHYCVIHDVTELRATENLKRLFLSMVSHDLRAPLQSIGLGLSALVEERRGHLPAATKAMLEKAQTNAAGVMQLANTLLELDKLVSSKPALKIEAVGAGELSKTAIDAVTALADANGVRINSPHGDAAMLVDERRILQCLTTLLSNVIKYARRGSELSVDIRHGQSLVEFRIQVDQSVISEAERATFTALLSQQKAEAIPPIRGTGLALASVKAIIEAHGGTVGLDQDAREHLCFWFTVPELEDEEP